MHVLRHAKILSNIRGSPASRPIFHYGAICYWRDIPKDVQGSSQSLSTIRAIRQLTCKALVYLARTSSLGQTTTSILMPTHTIQQDITAACREYINGEYDALEKGEFSGSFIDAFDIFSAGVVLIILGKASSFLGSPSEAGVLSKCTALLTIIGARFSALKTLCRVLWRLQESTDDRVSPGMLCNTILEDLNLISWEQVINDLPDLVPSSLRKLIKESVRNRHTLC